LSRAGTGATDAAAPTGIEQGFKAIGDAVRADDARERRRRVSGQGKQPDFGATIKSIDVDGKRYQLEDPAKKNAPEPGASPGQQNAIAPPGARKEC
jgi:hypothetical protein